MLNTALQPASGGAVLLATLPEIAQESEGARIAKSLGLRAQLELQRGDETTAKRFEHCLLTYEEENIWSEFMPTHYGTKRGQRSLENYAFDTIPVEVLKLWEQLKKGEHFDRFEIWTTEKRDPALIGVLEQRNWYGGCLNHMLARWGRDAPSVLSIEKVKRLLVERITAEIKEKTAFGSGLSGWYVFGMLVAGAAGLLKLLSMPEMEFPTMLAFAVTFAVANLVVIYPLKYRYIPYLLLKRIEDHRVIRAIRRHNTTAAG